MTHLLRRLACYLVTAWAAITVNFFLLHLMPGDPVQNAIARSQGKLTPQAIDALRAQGTASAWPLPVRPDVGSNGQPACRHQRKEPP